LILEVSGSPLPAGGFVITYTDISEQKNTEATISKINESLENRVTERTLVIQQTNIALENSLQQLQDTQQQLIQSEKLAALGQLVAGVAHEINTPVGVCVTAISFLADKTDYIKGLHEQQRLSSKEFQEFLENCQNSLSYTMKNLNKSAKLVSSFKQLSMEQYIEERQTFILYTHIQDLLLNLATHFAENKAQVMINGDQTMQMNSFPGIILQVFTSLILNSVRHGFVDKEIGQGLITISYQDKGDFMEICYADNGVGMDEEQVEKIFDPFYTTSRGKGDVGLGMHLVFNLVNQTLRGSISCQSKPGDGVLFTLKIPM